MLETSNTERRIWLGLLAFAAGVLLTVLVNLCAAYLAWGTRSYAPFALAFPYSALPELSGLKALRVLGVLLMVLQLPVYCITLATARDGRKLYRRTIVLLAVHLLATALTITLWWIKGGLT